MSFPVACGQLYFICYYWSKEIALFFFKSKDISYSETNTGSCLSLQTVTLSLLEAYKTKTSLQQDAEIK